MNTETVNFPRMPHPWITEGQNRVRFGIQLTEQLVDWPHSRDLAQFIEALGYDSIWMFDHPGLGFADCWTVLTALAATTKTIRLGALVSCIFYRSPWLVARLATDVDRLSQGRLVLGMGIGDAEEEFQRLCIPFPNTRTRQKMLEEAVQIVQGLLSGQPLTYHGEFFKLDQAMIAPGPYQQPRIPMVIAGGGEKVTLRQVAQYADVSNFAAHAWMGSAFTLKDVSQKYQALRSHCQSLGRDYNSVLRSQLIHIVLAPTPSEVEEKKMQDPLGWRDFTLSYMVAGTPSEAIEYFQTAINHGVQYFIASTLPDDRETLRLLAQEVIPALHISR